ncbi:response regulator transcription factor [Petralouisia muris]|uniref:Response regulator transcription factor n=1 Tax=Petralouisia muris TaxID=3032872 RepID=A0AC61RPZ1_9FIRM|nr:response regulator transcription factor [Petralouisia muris]TGY91106.1 response regulator transcription factor [Petralouisia muris]
MEKNILIMEDEISIQNIIRAFLENEGYFVTCADDGVQGLIEFRKKKYDLVLLDIMMPKMDGYTVCKMLRSETNVPIIMLTALDDDESQMKGFDTLVDDYITKPFSMPLVLRRIKAVLRRTDRELDDNMSVISCQNLQLDLKSYQVFRSGENVPLTIREFEILKILMENPGHVFSRDNLLNSVWGYDYYGDSKIVNTHIKNIRKKLGVDCIETIRGVGYRIVKES